MSVSTWAPARHISDEAVEIRAEVAIPPGGRVAGVGRRVRGGGAARERFSAASRPALRLVPPLPSVADWGTAATPEDMASEPTAEPASERTAEPARPTQPTVESGAARASGDAVLRDSMLASVSISARPSSRRSVAGPAARSVNSPGRARSTRAPVRLTRRGRLVLAGLLLVFAAAIVVVLASTVEAAAPSVPPRAVVVHPGDTLWSIAARVHPRGSLTDTMLTIERLNHMPDGTVYVGQQLLVPSS